MPMHDRAGSVQPRTDPAEEVSVTTRSPTRDLGQERDEWLTVEEVCTELKISRRTFDRWRARARAPGVNGSAGTAPSGSSGAGWTSGPRVREQDIA